MLVYFKIRPGKGQVTESDELFTLFSEFAESFKALVPKPKPLKQSRNANLSAAQERSGAVVGADDADELDPMLSRIQGVYAPDRPAAADGRTPESVAARRLRAPSGADATRSRVPSISELAHTRAPSTAERQRSSLPEVEESATRRRDSKAVDLKLQQRLAARFERAKTKPPR